MPELDSILTPLPGAAAPPKKQPLGGLLTPPVPATGTTAPKPVTPVQHRDFLDVDTTRKAIFDGVLSGLKEAYPRGNDHVELHLENLRYAGPEHFSLAEQKQAILDQRSLDRPVKGHWVLKDKKTGQELQRLEKIVARVPYMTHRGTFIFRGNEFTVANQQRLRPGVYARQKDNGELESHVNLLPGTGKAFRLHMEPDTGLFRIQVDQSHIPLLWTLKTLGANDSEISKAWGPELYEKNALKGDPGHAIKVFEKMADAKTKQAFAADPAAGLRHLFSKMGLDKEVTERNLGTAWGTVDKDVLLRATQKLLHIHQGKEEPDDRDSQANMTTHGPEDLFRERVVKDAGRIAHGLLWKATHRRSLDHVASGVLTPQLNSVLLSSGMGQPISEINPVEILDQRLRATRLGEGGIPSTDAIPEESRNVQPSQLGYVDPILGPESEKIGVDTRLAYGTLKGSDGLLYQKLLNPKTGQLQAVSAREAVHKVLAFPGEMEKPDRYVRAIKDGKMTYVKREQVDYAVAAPEHMFSVGANLIPGVSGIKGGRGLMAGKMVRQALPLLDAEAPMVQSSRPTGDSFESSLGEHVGAVKAGDKPGVVLRVKPGEITVQHDDGTVKKHELYEHFPFNYKTFIHNTPVVKPGERFTPGQLLAKSNYTDANGHLALGKNLRVAYMPYQTELGNNYEDAIVLSESAAKKLTSEHMTQLVHEPREGRQIGKTMFLSLFPGKYDRRQLGSIGDDGVIRPGTIVHKDDPLVLSASEHKPQQGAQAQLHRHNKSFHRDDALTWDHPYEGIVTDVSNGKDGVKVTVKSYRPIGVGDKMSGRFGDKGVVGAIVPDLRMPHNSDGQAMDVLLNPLGMISRTNPAQVIEAMLGKVARKRGQPFLLRGFSGHNAVQGAAELLKQHGLSDTDTLYDPHTKRHVKVLAGERFFYKLYHMAETKETGRDVGAYTAEESPAKGGEEGAKRVGLLDINALISHGATEVLKDAKLVRGQKNDQFWAAFRMGHPAPLPQTPMVYNKWLAYLQGAGINVRREGGKIHLMALTDKDVAKISGGALTTGKAVEREGNLPIPGGLFDPGITGGHHGTRWAHIDLHHPLPNPVMEEPIRRVLGMTGKAFEAKLAEPDGPAEIKRRLEGVNLDQTIELQKQIIRAGKKSKRDDAVKLLKYLTAAKERNLHPKDWLLSKFPVVPPAFRPVTQVNGMELTSDANHLYNELFEADQLTRQHRAAGLPAGQQQLDTYKAMKAVAGLGDPLSSKLTEKGVAGLLEHVFGKGSPKFGMFQRRVLSNTVDVVGRAAITPNPALDMDHVGLPESKAWVIYRPFIMRRLARRYNAGPQKIPMTEIAKWIADKDPRAKTAMLEEMNERPVLINRAPVWHKYGFMAAWPQLVKGDTLHISPITTPGFGADFDGDAMNYSVPVTDGAVRDAIEKMLPSRNLLSTKDFNVHLLPRQEYQHGLWLLSRQAKANAMPRIFESAAAVKAAYQRGEIAADTPVQIRPPASPA